MTEIIVAIIGVIGIIIQSSISNSTNKKIYDKYLQDSEGYSYVYKDKDNNDQDVYPLLKTYVNNYKEYLISLGVTNIVNIRLMSYAEAVENGCTTKENSCPLYISNQHYWLGSAYNSYKVWYVNAFRRLNYGSDKTGVRPLIIIPESSLWLINKNRKYYTYGFFFV